MRPGLTDAQVEQLARLLEALAAEADPPTTVKEPREAARVHLADSLAALDVPELPHEGRLADIGAGAGFPGLALAVARPALAVDLVESTRRKCEVIARLAGAAGLTNATPVPERAEDWARGGGAGAYDVVTARALAPLAAVAEYAAPLLREGGLLVAWKGRRDGAEEEAGAAAAAQLGMRFEVVRHTVPYAGARDHHLHLALKVGSTPDRFPRRAGQARKRPLA